MKYKASFVTPKSSDVANGEFEFEGIARKGTRANMTEARLAMIELFGKEGISFTITKIEKTKKPLM